MPLEFIMRFKCNKCGVELCHVAAAEVKEWPIVVEKLGVKGPPPGWTVKGYDCRCPEHASRIHLATAMPGLSRPQ